MLSAAGIVPNTALATCRSPPIRSHPPYKPRRCAITVSASPQIEVQVQTPQGQQQFKTESGDNCRLALLDEKADLYGLWGKVMNCGGGGNCGTCIVEVTEGVDLLGQRTAAEQKKLKGKPDSWRLACQISVGDGQSGEGRTVRLKTQPK